MTNYTAKPDCYPVHCESDAPCPRHEVSNDLSDALAAAIRNVRGDEAAERYLRNRHLITGYGAEAIEPAEVDTDSESGRS